MNYNVSNVKVELATSVVGDVVATAVVREFLSMHCLRGRPYITHSKVVLHSIVTCGQNVGKRSTNLDLIVYMSRLLQKQRRGWSFRKLGWVLIFDRSV